MPDRADRATAASCCLTEGARDRVLQLLYMSGDISGDVMRPDRRRHQAGFLAPGKEPIAGAGISAARVRVADVGGEEFDIASGSFVTEVGDQRRHDVQRTLSILWKLFFALCELDHTPRGNPR
jgi:hypothetical protein